MTVILAPPGRCRCRSSRASRCCSCWTAACCERRESPLRRRGGCRCGCRCRASARCSTRASAACPSARAARSRDGGPRRGGAATTAARRAPNGAPSRSLAHDASTIIAALGRGGPWHRARALELLRGLPPAARTTRAYNAAISACARGGDARAALALLDEMTAGDDDDGAADAAGKADADAAAGGAGRRPLVRRPRPSVVTYNAAISACARAAKPERALELLVEVRNDVSHEDLVGEQRRVTGTGCSSRFEGLVSREKNDRRRSKDFC